jgi:hypothetical protein
MRFRFPFIAAALMVSGLRVIALAQGAGGGVLQAIEGFSLANAMGVESPWEIGGWTNVAYYTNNIPLSFNDDDMLSFDDLPGRVNLAQQWLYWGRKADGSNGCDVGGRIDVIYGTDGPKSQAFGNPKARARGRGRFDASLDHGYYGWAIPQLYGEVAVRDFSVMVGHFATPIGYEETQAKDNFFHSHSYTSYDSEPFTHTGFLSKYGGFEKITFYGGWTAGWDSGFDSLNSGSNFLGGIEVDVAGDVKLSYFNSYGNFGWRDGGGEDSYSHSFVLEADLTDKLQYVANSDFLDTDNGAISQVDSIGLVQYLFYDVNDTVSLGARMEWWKLNGMSHYEATAGINWNVLENLVFRPEVRQDWIPGSDFDQAVFALDAVLTY